MYSQLNRPSGSAENNHGVSELQILHQWALGFHQTQSGCFGVTNPRQWALGFRKS
ncbi:Hypothetical protein FKW44_023304 [Caligus rogercresseyi]|uniref:Uncharacterized protein n=1 Tax=Caligus rogercresseyi TaxID=217165 RepID=A0A7T8JV06_CALRO|nr:Hypothetical protein FKW44_023304 [Caligus rogercresseyi]